MSYAFRGFFWQERDSSNGTGAVFGAKKLFKVVATLHVPFLVFASLITVPTTMLLNTTAHGVCLLRSIPGQM